MPRKEKKKTALHKPAAPLVAIFRQGFQREIFRDLQDFLYESFQRPSVVFLPLENGGTYSCFPRKREPLPDELFHHVVSLALSGKRRVIVEDKEREVVLGLLNKERKGEIARWGWRETGLGLIDLYVPVHLDGVTIAVLVFGKFLLPAAGLTPLQNWLLDIADQCHSADLRANSDRFVKGVPVLDGKVRARVQAEVVRLVSLTERFLDRTINTGLLFRDEELLDQLGLERPELNIRVEDLWASVQGALERILTSLPIKSAVAFASKYRDIHSLERKASVPLNLLSAGVLPLASHDELDWLRGQSWVNLPSAGPYFGWLDPQTLLGTDLGVLFGREMIGGHVVVLAFGLGERRLTPWQRAALYDAVTARIFSFIDRALFGIELDHLMAETGHLMGRAVAKVALGSETLQQVIEAGEATSENELYKTALWAIEDGKTRLELIQQNFYFFQTRRRWREQESAEDNLRKEEFDALQVLVSMRNYFDRAANEAQRKPINYHFSEAPSPVFGDRNALRLTILNIFDNALKFSYANTFFTIEFSLVGASCRMTFKSLGVGVARGETNEVFVPFAKSRYKDPTSKNRRSRAWTLLLPLGC